MVAAKSNAAPAQVMNGASKDQDNQEETDAQQVAANVNQQYDQVRESMRSWIPASYLQAFAKSGAKSSSGVKVTSDGMPLVRPARLVPKHERFAKSESLDMLPTWLVGPY